VPWAWRQSRLDQRSCCIACRLAAVGANARLTRAPWSPRGAVIVTKAGNGFSVKMTLRRPLKAAPAASDACRAGEATRRPPRRVPGLAAARSLAGRAPLARLRTDRIDALLPESAKSLQGCDFHADPTDLISRILTRATQRRAGFYARPALVRRLCNVNTRWRWRIKAAIPIPWIVQNQMPMTGLSRRTSKDAEINIIAQ
jgi:hypothetical protein